MRKTSTLPGLVFVVIAGIGLVFAYFRYDNVAYGESLLIAVSALVIAAAVQVGPHDFQNFDLHALQAISATQRLGGERDGRGQNAVTGPEIAQVLRIEFRFYRSDLLVKIRLELRTNIE